MFVVLLCLVVFSSQSVLCEESSEENGSEHFYIGAIFYDDEGDLKKLKEAFIITAENNNFTASIKTVPRGNLLDISNEVCNLAQEGVIGIIDGLGDRGTEHIQAICDTLELPHVIIQPMDLDVSSWSILNLYPSVHAFNNLLREVIMIKEWNNFTLLYEKGHSMRFMANLMEMGNFTDPVAVSVRELSGDDYRDVLIDAKEQGYTNFVVDCPPEKLDLVLLHAQQVGLMADEHSYIFLSPDLFTIDLSRYRYGGVNMTGFRLTGLNSYLWNFTAKLKNESHIPQDEDTDNDMEYFKTNMVLIHDSVRVFYEAVKKIVVNDDFTENKFKAEKLDCLESNNWEHGSSLLNFMKTNIIEGITSTLSFDGVGKRSDVTLDILELTTSGNQTIGKWKANKIEMNRLVNPSNDSPESLMANKTFKVLMALTPPYTYLKESTEELEGNDRYEGYAVDLIDSLAKMQQFNYELQIEGNYTTMALDLKDDRADFAICDFTITTARQKLVDFSTPFMTLGIGILYKEPSKQPPEMFSFMAVFAKEVWLWMLFIQMGIGVIMIFVGRISNKEWQNPVPCVEQPEELNNQFSFANSIWLIIGSVMQQGSEIAPIALAPRMITSVWWFFTMVIVASYVGTLVAFLTVTKNVFPFNNPKELLEHKSITYGVKKDGSTDSFFKSSKDPIYEKLNRNMLKVSSNDEGVRMAENSTFAFFSESSAIEYYTSRHCDLIQIGDLLDSKSYGIGMKKDSPYKKDVDDALLKLKEQGELSKMYDKWWKEKRGGGKCLDKKEEEAKQLSMDNMKGAFVVLGVGCVCGLVISILEMLWWVFKRSVKYKTTFKYELVEELKFAIKFQGDVKPVKRPPKSSDGSEEAFADDVAIQEEAKDELGSLRSARTMRSGRSTSSKSSYCSHGSRHSRHSPNELTVAFARRRKYS